VIIEIIYLLGTIMLSDKDRVILSVQTPVDILVRTTSSYWEVLIEKHPDIEDHFDRISECLKSPSQIRRSKQDNKVLLFYLSLEKYILSVVVKREHSTGFIITAYRTDKIKEGEVIWKR